MACCAAQMEGFASFRRSVEPLKERITQAQQFTPQNMTSREWAVLEEIFPEDLAWGDQVQLFPAHHITSVHDLDVVDSVFAPAKADPPRVVDPPR